MNTITEFAIFIEKHNNDPRMYKPWVRVTNQADKLSSSYSLFRNVRQGCNTDGHA